MSLPHTAVNEQPFFDPIRLTTGGLPTLVQVIEQALNKDIQERLERLKADGRKVITLEQARRRVTLAMFGKFAADYLAENRVVEVFAVDANVGLVLSNHVRCVVCPGTDVAGTMQESGAVGVTSGRSQAGMPDGVDSYTYGVN